MKLLPGLSTLLFIFSITLTALAQAPHYGVTAHRGNSDEYPENTIPAFKSAIELGVDWLELDIFLTKDGKLVVTHDARTGRVGDIDLEISKSTYAELKKVDVATAHRKTTGKTISECPAEHIPLLEDVLTLLKTQKKTKVSIQPKADCVAQAIALIKKKKAFEWVGFNDGSLKYMSEVKRLSPATPVFWDLPADSDIEKDIATAKSKGFEALVLNHKGVTEEKVKKIKEAGLEPGAWTVNNILTMQDLLKLGIKRLYTDAPRDLIALMYRSQAIECAGTYPQHVQGVCMDSEENFYWSWTDQIVKTDKNGAVLKKVKAPSHQGDLCYVDGSIFVAVNLGQFNQPAGKENSWVFQFDAKTLQEIKRFPVPELVHGAGGMAYHNGRFMVIGGLPKGTNENYMYEYDTNFKFISRHVINSGYTEMGIQTIAYANGYWWLGCYGTPRTLLKVDKNFTIVGRSTFDASVGIIPYSPQTFLISTNKVIPGQKLNTAKLKLAIIDPKELLVTTP